jgi:hypothetical protein
VRPWEPAATPTSPASRPFCHMHCSGLSTIKVPTLPTSSYLCYPSRAASTPLPAPLQQHVARLRYARLPCPHGPSHSCRSQNSRPRTDAIWAASPTTTRGQATPLSSDPKGERLAYAVGRPARGTAHTAAANGDAAVGQVHLPSLHRRPRRQYTVHAAHGPDHRRPLLALGLLRRQRRRRGLRQGVGLRG